jgi:ubiquinone/menaquinone biosynthesis C-methylase UbiE
MSIEADNITDLYERHARTYDRDRGRKLVEKTWLDRFLAQMNPPRLVLDVGCGSGEPIARYLIGLGCQLTGVDVSLAPLPPRSSLCVRPAR